MTLQKCKPAKHLRVIVERAVPSTTLTAVFIAQLACRNPDEGPNPTWGAILDPPGRAQGMQLFPDAVDLLAHQLPIVAAEAKAAGGTAVVSIQHTVSKGFTTWKSVPADNAVEVGSELAAFAP